MALQNLTHYGGARDLGAGEVIGPHSERTLSSDPSGAQDLTLPDARLLPLGIPFLVVNLSGSFAITVKNNGGSSLYVLAANEGRRFILNDNSTANGVWRLTKVFTVNHI
ncbi:MAG: hypothetical protein FVQ84_08575 [Planctomycetes bacterium]|nr:hypothetical protein [Planctomycetota bacterium]